MEDELNHSLIADVLLVPAIDERELFQEIARLNLGIDRGQMTESTERTLDSGQKARWDFTFAFLVLRLWLGVRALFVGIEKFGAYHSVATPLIDPSTGQPDASGVMVNVNIKSYALANYAGIPAALRDKFAHEPLLPKFALVAFDRMLGPAFILTGIMLLIGLGTRVSLLAQAAALYRADGRPGSDRPE